MNEMGLAPGRRHVKCAKVVGEVMGNYHPHGDQAIYDTLVRMGQCCSMRYTLVDPQGNFGSVDGDPPAAMRYTEARLSRIATEMLRDLDEDTVDFVPNYDGTRTSRPSCRPASRTSSSTARSGIAVGMATNIPPHNLGEDDRRGHRLHRRPARSTSPAHEAHQGPGLPDRRPHPRHARASSDAYRTGRGRVACAARAHTEQLRGGREAIIITELPYQVKKGGDGGVIEQIAELVRREEDRRASPTCGTSPTEKGMRIVIELKRDANPKVVLNKLFKHTPMQTTFGVNTVALVDGVPKTLSPPRDRSRPTSTTSAR